MRHAWLIIAHNEFAILQQLIDRLDSPEMDFFIHVDKKVSAQPSISVRQGKLFVLKERIDVRWGSVSQIRCEMALFRTAREHGDHDFYHIISGTTLPLVDTSELKDFFSAYNGKNVLSGLCKDLPYQETLKMRRYNLFLKNYAKKGYKGKVSQFLWKSGIAVQRLLGIERNRGKVFFKASNWLSLSEEAVDYLLSHEAAILRKYRYSFCGDEYFVPTELMDSPLKEKLINCEHYLKCTIARSTSDVYHLSDFSELCKSGYLFARKFSSR